MNNLLNSASVAASCGHEGYPIDPPYSPREAWPEYPFEASTANSQGNPAYDAVRDSFRLLGLDDDCFGASSWNPLGEVVRPGDTVLLKPNFVRDFRDTRPGDGECLITHGSIIRAVLDYVLIALRGRGRIIIADAPHHDADFDMIRRIAGLDEIRSFYRTHAGVDIAVLDLRPERAHKIDGVIVGHSQLAGDPAGYVKVNLAERSTFCEINDLCAMLYGSEYDTSELCGHQHDDTHEYLIAKSVLAADVVISLPKLKTHKKVGLTANMKNLVGINGNKNWLPHYRLGTPAQKGDQFPDDRLKHRIERATVSQFKRLFPLLGRLRSVVAGPIKKVGRTIFGDTNAGTIRSGNWHGNDTAWRMVNDLNRILYYADAGGMLHDRPVRRFFSVVDGIVAGEGNGPLDPSPKRAGVVLSGGNPVAVDLAAARMMGFDYRRLPMLARALDDHTFPLATFKADQVTIRSNEFQFDGTIGQMMGRALAFLPAPGWRRHVEACDGVLGDNGDARAVRSHADIARTGIRGPSLPGLPSKMGQER